MTIYFITGSSTKLWFKWTFEQDIRYGGAFKRREKKNNNKNKISDAIKKN